MKVRNDEGFLFPTSQYDFRGGFRGLGALNGSPAFEAAIRAQTAKFSYELKKISQDEWLAAAAGVDYGALSEADLNKAIRIGYEYAVNGQAAGDAMRAAEDQNIQAAAAQQAANAAAQAAAQAQAQQAAQQAAAQAQADAAAREAAAQAEAVAKAAAATANAQAVQAVIDAQLAAQQAAATTNAQGVNMETGSVRLTLSPSEQQVAAATNTQKTAVDTTSGTVKTVDTASGVTSTANAQTGAVVITLPTGEKFTGVTSVTAGGVKTSVDPKTGAVTTQNTQTGVATQTNATTGQTATGVQVTGTPATGGTFMLPGGGTVTTTEPITGGGLDAGKIALVGLVGLLLLRGAIK
jgi:multidrug efflux pump subunit AcrA (membrane-fusion protein)